MLDMAKLFTSRGVKTTIISTSAFSEPIEKAQESGIDIGLRTIKFPPKGSELPDDFVSLNLVNSDEIPIFVKALALVQEQVEKLVQELNPGCLVSDMFLTWTVESAAKIGIPRLVFHGTSYFALCAGEQMKRHKSFKNVSPDSEPFVLPNLPHQLKFVRTQIPSFELLEVGNEFSKLMEQIGEAMELLSTALYGLEPDYADHYQKVLGRKSLAHRPLTVLQQWGPRQSKTEDIIQPLMQTNA